MAKKLKVLDSKNGVMFDSRRETLTNKGEAKPEVVMLSPEGNRVTKKQLGADNLPVQYSFKYIDGLGKVWAKEELTFKVEGEETSPLVETKLFEIKTYRPVSEYLDRFIVEKFYELSPEVSMDGKKKSVEIMERLRVSNLLGMRKLWEKLDEEQVVAGGHFNVSSGGFNPGMAFIRAINENGCKWGLELGVFKEEKIFQFMNEGIPSGDSIKHIVDNGAKQLKSSLL